jgi:uncharacterized surface protein with fasciclin (FAS1) repeats
MTFGIGITLTVAAAALACDGAKSASSSACTQNTGVAVVGADYSAKLDIVDTAVAAGSFKTLAAALQAANLIETLKGPGPFTVFAPTDEAFAKLPKGTVENLLKPENRDALVAVLTYHVVPGTVKAADVVKLTSATTVNGQRAAIVVENDTVRIDNATVVKTDIAATNGVIHVIDTVILPETDTIPQVAASAGSFGTLLKAVEAAGLSETLSGPGPFTVFAPTDAAFAKLGPNAIADLLKPENKATLAAILTYHVVPGRVFADQVVGLSSVKTVQGSTAAIKVTSGTVTIDGATVTATDIEAANGVIHVIDTVITPE